MRRNADRFDCRSKHMVPARTTWRVPGRLSASAYRLLSTATVPGRRVPNRDGRAGLARITKQFGSVWLQGELSPTRRSPAACYRCSALGVAMVEWWSQRTTDSRSLAVSVETLCATAVREFLVRPPASRSHNICATHAEGFESLDRAQLAGCWLSVGPLRPGIRIGKTQGSFPVGNAAGETHPLIGEGINMALQSAYLLTNELTKQPVAAIDVSRSREIHRDYAAAWRSAFAHRLRLAAAFAHLAMRPALSVPATAVLRRWPLMLAEAARWAGKARSPIVPSSLCEDTP